MRKLIVSNKVKAALKIIFIFLFFFSLYPVVVFSVPFKITVSRAENLKVPNVVVHDVFLDQSFHRTIQIVLQSEQALNFFIDRIIEAGGPRSSDSLSSDYSFDDDPQYFELKKKVQLISSDYINFFYELFNILRPWDDFQLKEKDFYTKGKIFIKSLLEVIKGMYEEADEKSEEDEQNEEDKIGECRQLELRAGGPFPQGIESLFASEVVNTRPGVESENRNVIFFNTDLRIFRDRSNLGFKISPIVTKIFPSNTALGSYDDESRLIPLLSRSAVFIPITKGKMSLSQHVKSLTPKGQGRASSLKKNKFSFKDNEGSVREREKEVSFGSFRFKDKKEKTVVPPLDLRRLQKEREIPKQLSVGAIHSPRKDGNLLKLLEDIVSLGSPEDYSVFHTMVINKFFEFVKLVIFECKRLGLHHLDLKLDNILFEFDRKGELKFYLTDFGFTKKTNEIKDILKNVEKIKREIEIGEIRPREAMFYIQSDFYSTMMRGTVSYIAPELAYLQMVYDQYSYELKRGIVHQDNLRPILSIIDRIIQMLQSEIKDQSLDIWSLGVTLYAVLHINFVEKLMVNPGNNSTLDILKYLGGMFQRFEHDQRHGLLGESSLLDLIPSRGEANHRSVVRKYDGDYEKHFEMIRSMLHFSFKKRGKMSKKYLE